VDVSNHPLAFLFILNMKTAKIVLLTVLVVAVTIGTVWYSYNNSSKVVASEKSVTDTKFEEIYITIRETGEYIRDISDTNVRNFHYTKPHKKFTILCPECAEPFAKPKEDLVEVPVERLKELRTIRREVLSLPTPSDQSPATQPVEELTTLEELDSVLRLLKGQKSHLYTNRYIMEMQYHYLKKHTHPRPGTHGGCPDCIKLRTKQTQETEIISQGEYDLLIQLEKEYTDK
tara:strand:- start:1390 stop:2082 length:693 start_codon:yes stop_codon:yes gene_type:complete